MEKNRMLHNAGLLQETELKFTMEFPKEIHIIYDAFKKANQDVFLVGGCVRDALLGITPKDYDIVTSTHPADVIKILNDAGIHNIPIGVAFGVVSAVINGQEFEIATMRAESYEGGDGRRPTSVEFSDMKTDSARRDISVNALYYNISEHKIIDLVGGLEDLKNKRIRAVGNVMDRLKEDKLRVCRLIRFSNRFGSELDDDTKKAIWHFRELSGVSNERVRDEFIKGIKSAIKPEKFLEDYKNFGLLPRLLNGVSLDTEFISGLSDPILVLAKMLSPNPINKALKSLEKLTASNEEKSNIKFLLSLVEKFKDFDKLSFVPETDGKWLMSLQSSKMIQNKDLTDNQIMQWAEIMGLNKPAIKRLIDSKFPYSATDFPEMPQGKELGDAISKANAEYFINGL